MANLVIWLIVCSLSACGAEKPPDSWGPVVSLSHLGVVICFKSNPNEEAWLEIWDDQGETTNRIYTKTDAKGLFHVGISELRPGICYYYRVCQFDGNCTDIGRFFTPPTLGTFLPFTFLVYGDTQSNNYIHRNVAAAMSHEFASFAVLVGDSVETPIDDEWNKFFECGAPLFKSMLFFAVLGNHEQNSRFYYDFYEFPKGGGKDGDEWWAFRWDDVLFVGLDSNLQYLSAANFAGFEAETRWLETVLNQEARYKFVFFHHPPFCSHPWANIALAEAWATLFERHHVTAVFNGHIHYYEHIVKNDVHYFITGGGSNPSSQLRVPRTDGSVCGIQGIPHYLRVTVQQESVTIEMVAVDGLSGSTVTMDFVQIFKGK
ncbi:MAG: metallophosphoesterase [Candidatus Hadarchaeum sp.]|uniref:metallophosphoesterase family protein n=1 Tax=Candidatus Hadarchaeum sp. TaxID=2883567 RepID=UPI00317C7DB4